jgi:hypothetical protein
MSALVVLEWKFSPPDYFETPIEISRDDYTLIIADGRAEARIDDTLYTSNPSMREALHGALNDRFLGVQLLTHKGFELSKPMMTRVHPDGRRDASVEVEGVRVVATVQPVDFQIVDKGGNVATDSKRARIEKEKTLADLISTYRASDGILASVLRSYSAAVGDPANELVHLFEIREALSGKFGGEMATRSALRISSSAWSRLGQLSNNEPLRQGRHRGKTGGALRDATDAELSEARGIARAMIQAYVGHLARASRAGDPR